MTHPIQDMHIDEHETLRFKQNKIVRFLFDAGPFDMNALALMPFDSDDRQQFAQLIGYSVSGFGDLSYAHPETIEEADRLGRQVDMASKSNPHPDVDLSKLTKLMEDWMNNTVHGVSESDRDAAMPLFDALNLNIDDYV